MKFISSVFNLTRMVYIPEESPIKNGKGIVVENDLLPYGIVIDPSLLQYIDYQDILPLIEMIDNSNIPSYQGWSNSFYRDWEKVENTGDLQKYVDHVLHYLTVFFSDLNLLDEDKVYVPDLKEVKLDIQDVLNKPFIVLRPITREDVEGVVKVMLNSGIALSDEKRDNLLKVIDDLGLNQEELLAISNNREFSCVLQKALGIVPQDPVEALRQVLYESIGSTLIIKDKSTIGKLKISPLAHEVLVTMIDKDETLIDRFAEIFFRNKPLFLAMKKDPASSAYINRIRKRANKLHKPLNLGVTIVSLIESETLDIARLKKEMANHTPFRIVSTFNALNNAIFSNQYYRIRNGKMWAEEKPVRLKKDNPLLLEAQKALLEVLVSKLKDEIQGAEVLLPKNLEYAVPSSIKNFVGFIPSGSYVEFDEDKNPIVGVHWVQAADRRVDLDLSLINAHEKIGWDGRYGSHDIYFSGDMTNAPPPEGASEYFRFNDILECSYLLHLNSYTMNYSDYNIIIGQKDPTDKDNIFKFSDAIYSFQGGLDNTTMLGAYIQGDTKRFYLTNMERNMGRTSFFADHMQVMLKSILERMGSVLTIRELLEAGGAKIVDNFSDSEGLKLDLLVENLSAATFLNLFK